MLQLQHKNSNKGPLWLVESKYIIGCDDESDIKLPKSSATDKYAELLVNGDDIDIVNISQDEAPKVNGVAVRTKQRLRAGDEIRFGEELLLIIDPKARKRQTEAPVSNKAVDNSDAPEEAKPQWAFKALNTALADRHYPLAKSQTIGRSNECDISLGVVHLSRKHAMVSVTDSGLLIEDLKSSNGTYINAKKITRATAIAGDEVSFDTLRFRVIGPVLDSNKTYVRTTSDGDLTTIRPALKLADHGIEEAVPSPRAKSRSADAKTPPAKRETLEEAKAQRAVKTQPHVASAQTAANQHTDEENNKSSMGLLLLLAVAAAAVIAWYLITRG